MSKIVKIVFGILALLILVALGYIMYMWYVNKPNPRQQNSMDGGSMYNGIRAGNVGVSDLLEPGKCLRAAGGCGRGIY